ncbi:hypothetical protein F8M41_004549 [Gigaspora margarita]|uniref:Uncharacterized protein n=1 Tax=Gigaspora margarita TaxID=4874 RepID=A0A8H3X9J4_GIGMA|nr:hypothetical protein F8M41_004549 [Gigaspora margarita]
MFSSQIPSYFKKNKDWSLLSFLYFRKYANNFVANKATEHLNYKKALEIIILLDSSNRVKAERCLVRFKVEKLSESVIQFWKIVMMESIEYNYSMHALNTTIYEKSKIHEIVSDSTIAEIEQNYRCNESRIPKSLDYINDKENKRNYIPLASRDERIFKKQEDNEKGSHPLNGENRQEIEAAYKTMKKEQMWRLKSGRYVEEVLYKIGLSLTYEHNVHSFIIDAEDETVKKHFDERELEEISDASGPLVPNLSDDVIEYLKKFLNKKSIKEIRQTINEKDDRFDVDYDKEVYHDLDYIRLTIYSLVREIENAHLDCENLEQWYNCHIWNAIFDQSFGNMKEISVVRGDGCKGDWIIRTNSKGNKNEFGYGEVGKTWIDKSGIKFLREVSLKSLKTLKDMLIDLMRTCKWNPDALSKLQTVGVVHSGLVMMVIRMDNPKGYICRVNRSNIMEVPHNEENFSDILEILAAVLNLKSIVKQTMKIVDMKSVLSEKMMVETFLQAGLSNKRKHIFEIPVCTSTPKKTKSLE